jgi:hypothetical protein
MGERQAAQNWTTRSISVFKELTEKTSASAQEGASAGAQMRSESEHLNTAVQGLRQMLGLSNLVQGESEPVRAMAGAPSTFESFAESEWK